MSRIKNIFNNLFKSKATRQREEHIKRVANRDKKTIWEMPETLNRKSLSDLPIFSAFKRADKPFARVTVPVSDKDKGFLKKNFITRNLFAKDIDLSNIPQINKSIRYDEMQRKRKRLKAANRKLFKGYKRKIVELS